MLLNSQIFIFSCKRLLVIKNCDKKGHKLLTQLVNTVVRYELTLSKNEILFALVISNI